MFPVDVDFSDMVTVNQECRNWLRIVALMVAAFILSPLMFMYIQHRIKSKYYGERVFLKEDCGLKPLHNQNQTCFSHPKCMDDWIISGRQQILDIFQNRYFHSDGMPHEEHIKYSTSHNSALLTADAGLLQYLHHFPHFSEAYFNFFSLAVWSCTLRRLDTQHPHPIGLRLSTRNRNRDRNLGEINRSRRLSTNVNSTTIPVIDSFIIHETSRQFWSMKQDGSTRFWIRDLVNTVDKAFNTKTILCSTCNQTIDAVSLPKHFGGWFLYPTDAFLLGSLILNEDPCMYKNSYKNKVNTNNTVKHHDNGLSLGILNRKNDRQVLNHGLITEYFKMYPGLISSTTNFILDGKTLKEQARLLRSLDVVLTVHGAGTV